MDIDEPSIEEKCENLMNVVVEYRKVYGKKCINYELKSSIIENKMLDLQLEAISNFRVKPRNTSLKIEDADGTDSYNSIVEILEQQKRAENLRRRIKSTQEVVLQLKNDKLGKRLHEPLTAENLLAIAKSKKIKSF